MITRRYTDAYFGKNIQLWLIQIWYVTDIFQRPNVSIIKFDVYRKVRSSIECKRSPPCHITADKNELNNWEYLRRVSKAVPFMVTNVTFTFH